MRQKHLRAKLFFIDQKIEGNDVQAAHQELSSLLEKHGFNVGIAARFYRTSKTLGNSDSALQQIRRTATVDGSNVNNTEFVANLYFLEQQPETVIELLSSIDITVNDNGQRVSSNYWKLLSSSYLATGNKDKVLETLALWLNNKPDSLLAYSQNISFRTLMKDYEGALDITDTAINRFTNAISFSYQKLNLLLLSNQLEQAEKTLAAIPEEFQSSDEYKSLQGRLFFQQGNYAQALPLLEKWNERKPSLSNTRMLALAYSATQQKTKAISTIEAYLTNESANPDEALLMVLASLYGDNNENKALKTWSDIVNLNERNIVALNNAAWIYYKRDELDKAESLILKALSVSPANVNVNDTYLSIIKKAGKQEQIKKHIAEIRNLAKHDEKFRALIARFDQG